MNGDLDVDIVGDKMSCVEKIVIKFCLGGFLLSFK